MRSTSRLWRAAAYRSSLVNAFLEVKWARDARRGPVLPARLPPAGGVVPALRRDGVGIQALCHLCARQFARRHGAAYLHVPFVDLAHQEADPVGRACSTADWAARWESMLGIGVGEATLAGFAAEVGALRAAVRLWEGARAPDVLPTPAASPQLHVTTLDLVRQADRLGATLDASALAEARAGVRASGFEPSTRVYDEAFLDVALHIRRGDVWAAVETGTGRGQGFRVRFLSEAYYVDLIASLDAALAASPRPVRFHIFSDGEADQFPRFTFVSPTEATLTAPSGATIGPIVFHLRTNAQDTLHHLATAPVLVPARSAFSALAIVIGEGTVLYDERTLGMELYTPLVGYLEGADRAVPLGRLDQGLGRLVEARAAVR